MKQYGGVAAQIDYIQERKKLRSLMTAYNCRKTTN